MTNIKYIFPIIIIFFISCNNDLQTEIPDSRTKIINASEINIKIKKGEDLTYKNATIMGDIDFTQSNEASLITGNLVKHYVNSAVIFYDCTFKGTVLAVNYNKDFKIVTNFNKSVSFINCTFQDTVNFSASDFKGLVNFSNSMFQKFVSFKSVFVGLQGMYFNKTHFIEEAKFNMMHINGNCNFSDAVFDNHVLFQLSKFDNPVIFNAAVFNKTANFTKVKFFDDVFFNYSEFYKIAQFNTSIFRGRTEFIKSKFNMISEFKNCLFFSETKFSDAEISGILTFENSIFYVSDPNNFNVKASEESDYIFDGIVILSKK